MKTFRNILILLFAAGLFLAVSACSDIKEPEIFTVSYIAAEGGYIDGDDTQTIEKSKDGRIVTAAANNGYVFQRWSDGNTNHVRQDKNIQHNINVTAYFEKEVKKFTVIYLTTDGGFIQGEKSQSVEQGKDSTAVTAKANEGYEFVKWDDNKTTAERQETNVQAHLSFTAVFNEIAKPASLTVVYIAGEGGSIDGKTNQTILYGNSAAEVKAVPDAGYKFARWSDTKSSNPTRNDNNIITDITAKAEFDYVLADGSGTAQKPRLIETYEQFLNIKLYPNLYYKLNNDLDFSGIDYKPFFDNITQFEGIFDGNDKGIKNLNINSYLGFPSLFGFIGQNGKVKNLNIIDFSITVPNFDTSQHFLYVGAVAGISLGALSEINVIGSITGQRLSFDGVAIGGIVGQATSLITNCNSDVIIDISNVLLQDEIAQPFNIGGLIGVASGNIISCNANAKINVNQVVGSLIIGGLIGFFNEANEYSHTIADCFAYVEIYGDTSMMSAGLIAQIATVQISVKIENCGAEGQITGSYEASGFIHHCTNSTVIKNSYSKVNITTHAHAAGFVGYFSGGAISNCYATGNVIAVSDWESNVAGFCYTSSQASFYQCYFIGSLHARGAAGFLYRMGGAESDELVEECFSTGTINATLFAAGFIFMQNGKIINCYSSSNINVVDMEPPRKIIVGGFCASADGLGIENCYYSGKITLPSNYSEDSSIIGAFIGILDGGIITNCALIFQENSSINKVIFENYTTINPDISIYNTIMDANCLFAKLNNGLDNPVWVDVPNEPPRLRYFLSSITN